MPVKKILFITLSNIGDAVLTLPVLDVLLDNFPGSKVTVMAGPRSSELFENNPQIEKLIIYDKHARLIKKIELFFELRSEGFDMVVNLRNSLLGVLLSAPLKTPSFLKVPGSIKHMRDRHLHKIRKFIPEQRWGQKVKHNSLYVKEGEEENLRRILKENGITENDKVIVIAPGSRSSTKRWGKEKFLRLLPELGAEKMTRIILIGDQDDSAIAQYIERNSSFKVLNLCSRTTLNGLVALLKRADLLITNDSASSHLASYLNKPVVAIFGPTDDLKYGPWSDNYAVVKKDIFCRPCEKAQCRFGTLECMRIIQAGDVLKRVREVAADARVAAWPDASRPRRILIVRTDRIGDVILSTPVIKALREAYPDSYLAMMVAPYAREVLEGNPYLDNVFIYDKDLKQKGWLQSVKFALFLKKQKFDLALILHPTNRAHLVTFLAGIKRRIGYDRKFAFLLTDKLRHAKEFGEKHESEYNLDLVRYLGIKPGDSKVFMPLKDEAQVWLGKLLKEAGIEKEDRVLAINPGASCRSKLWPDERFAQVADILSQRHGLKVVLVSAASDLPVARDVGEYMRTPSVNLAGKTSLSQLASVLKRCALFISNDSGPVHIASALGTPVISIFGRNQPGLSPRRWGPLGDKAKILHKEIGCIQCLAHNCKKEYSCLKEISVEEVVSLAEELLKE